MYVSTYIVDNSDASRLSGRNRVAIKDSCSRKKHRGEAHTVIGAPRLVDGVEVASVTCDHCGETYSMEINA